MEISVTSQTAGTSAVTASINSSTASRNVTFVADVRTAQIASLEVTQDNSVADGAMANTLRVKVTDANGNALAGQTVSVTAGNGAFNLSHDQTLQFKSLMLKELNFVMNYVFTLETWYSFFVLRR